MSSAIVSPSEDEMFDALWGFISGLFDPSLAAQFIKGYQNLTSTPLGTYCVISPGVLVRLNQGQRSYDASGSLLNVQRNSDYYYQVDCYGPQGPDWANIISAAWNSLYSTIVLADAPITPLYADEPQQLNIVNGELQYEQRYMTKLHLQTNQIVGLPQLFFTEVDPSVYPPADLPPSG